MKGMRVAAAAATAIVVALFGAGTVKAGTLTTVNDTSATDLANELTSGGAGGITITNQTLSTNTQGSAASSGIFSTSGTNNYGLTGSGIVISSGNAAQDGTSGPVISGVSTTFGVPATASQTSLLSQVTSAPNGFFDVTELTITFTAGPTTSQVFFNTVFGSAEFPEFVGSFIDGFGLFLNGTNIAFAGGDPVNIDSPLMVDTTAGGSQFQTTPLQGLLVENGSSVVTYSGAVTPGSTGNTLTFIIADANDDQLDTTAFIQGLGNAPPTPGVPELSTWVMMLLGFAGLGYAGSRKARIVRFAA